MREITKLRVAAAKMAIRAGGGSTELARALTEAIGTEITSNRVAKWMYHGVPVHFGPTVARITGIAEHRLNPQAYTTDPQLINRLLTQ